jgi:hypothetical protein
MAQEPIWLNAEKGGFTVSMTVDDPRVTQFDRLMRGIEKLPIVDDSTRDQTATYVNWITELREERHDDWEGALLSFLKKLPKYDYSYVRGMEEIKPSEWIAVICG